MSPGELRAVILGALVGLLVVATAGCSHVPRAKEACLVYEDRQKAAELVIPHLVGAAMCAVRHETDDEQLACVEQEMQSFKAQVKPVVHACGLALVGDAIEAAK